MGTSNRDRVSPGLPWPLVIVPVVALVVILVAGFILQPQDEAASQSVEVGRGSLTRVDLGGLECFARKTMQGVGVACDFEGHADRSGSGELTGVDRDGVTVAAARDGDDLCVVADSAQGTAVTCSFGHFTDS